MNNKYCFNLHWHYSCMDNNIVGKPKEFLGQMTNNLVLKKSRLVMLSFVYRSWELFLLCFAGTTSFSSGL